MTGHRNDSRQREQIAKLLIDHDARPHDADRKHGQQPVVSAAKNNLAGIVHILLDAYARKGSSDTKCLKHTLTPSDLVNILETASQSGSNDVVELMMQKMRETGGIPR